MTSLHMHVRVVRMFVSRALPRKCSSGLSYPRVQKGGQPHAVLSTRRKFAVSCRTSIMSNSDLALCLSQVRLTVMEALLLSNILPVLGPEAVWTTCAEPAPVANTYRNVTQSELGNDINYTCYSSYTHKEGDLDRRCQATGQYSGTPPTCGLVCGPVKPFQNQNTLVLTDDEGGIAFTLCEDEYPTESSSSGEREITCSADLGRWQPLVFYCGKILDLHNISLSSTLTTGAAGWVTQEEVAPEWEAGLAAPDARELYDVDEVSLLVGDTMTDAVLTVAQTGGSFGECGNVTTSSIERLYLLKCDTRQGRKPWGHSIKVTARFLDGNPGRLELRDVSVQGRVHADNCPSPLNIPRLEMTSALQSDYVSGDTVEYACISGLHELRGSGVSECSPFGSWTTPTLVCTDEENFARWEQVETRAQTKAGGWPPVTWHWLPTHTQTRATRRPANMTSSSTECISHRKWKYIQSRL
ncbi:uncharacterized protein LOC112556407 [Pomacea canaliculata]|uniref:uncharacterized protein LOC112556407 n=1 Tax=Pomacea canaliculata TaxID=400727 RepID=UPI000D7266B4|nr:uncharacterized protein LOC112556407 [Pomacea canaliculata]